LDHLEPYETELIGSSAFVDGRLVPSDTTRRINALITKHLVRVADARDGWGALYRDPDDGRLWELTYPQGELQGGGPPSLARLSEEEARRKYSF
jgi:hypothetical protein